MGSVPVIIIEVFPGISPLVEEMSPMFIKDAILEVEMVSIDPAVENGNNSPGSTEAQLLRLVGTDELAALQQGG